MGLWNNKDNYGCHEVSNKSKVDNTWPKCVIKRKGVKTRAQREGVVFARIQIQMQMDRSGGRKMRKFSRSSVLLMKSRIKVISQK